MELQMWLGTIADIIGILGAIFALGAWLQTRLLQKRLQEEEQRRNQEVKVVLQHNGHSVELPLKLLRSELTRAEVMGRLGMMPMKIPGIRFSLKYVSNPQFVHDIDEIRRGSSDKSVLVIPCTQQEIEQFDLPLNTKPSAPSSASS